MEVREPKSRFLSPHSIVKRMNAFATCGYDFHTPKRDESKKT